MRVALVQPMRVVSGGFETNGYEVVDRTTGELGLVSREFALDRTHSLALETSWSAPLSEQLSVSGFMRFEETYGLNAEQPVHLAGASFQLRF